MASSSTSFFVLLPSHHHRHHHRHQYFNKSMSPGNRNSMNPKPTTSSSSSSTSSSFDLQIYWASLISEIDGRLEAAVPLRRPETIHEAMRYSILGAGAKRAPPVMCVAACEAVGGNREAAFPTACALEMVHAASLVHDDLPCMDNDAVRRGRPSNHAVFGVDMAILAGVALFPLGFQHIVSQTPPEVAPDRVLAVIAEIARTVGSTGMVSGQYLDLKCHNGGDNGNTLTDKAKGDDIVGFIMEKKYGELAECSAVCGGILGGGTEEEVERLRMYGKMVGLLYEVVEDVMEEERKSKGSENGVARSRERNVNYVKAYGLERAVKLVQELREKAKMELSLFKPDAALALYSFVDYAAERDFDPITT